jgi:OmpA-OmpF porin, OOP family
MTRSTPALLGLAALAACALAQADPLGLYVGAGAGQATIRQDYYQIDAHDTGWKVFGGFRPLSFIGAEIEYADLGSKGATYALGPVSQHIDSGAHATSLFAVGYLPVPLPWLDLYAKAGAARLSTKTTVDYGCSGVCPVIPTGSRIDTDNTKFAWGAGLQAKFGLPGVRFEYERFNAPQGDLDLISLNVTLNF